ncbi:hypothetical protein B0H14DRAFT_2691046, partial [Mycena olivaceomarginata]
MICARDGTTGTISASRLSLHPFCLALLPLLGSLAHQINRFSGIHETSTLKPLPHGSSDIAFIGEFLHCMNGSSKRSAT